MYNLLNTIFRPYTKADFLSIQTIHAQNHRNYGGLLVGSLYPDNYYVLEKHNKIIAYANILLELPDRVIRQSEWDIPKKAKPQGIYIRQTAVDVSLQGQGIGTMLYQELFGLFPDKDYFSHVRDTNQQSLHFHEKNGFVRIGLFETDDFFGINHYRAFLMGRILNR